MDIAITRDVPRSIARCELAHIAREPIDIARALAQHEAYCHELTALGHGEDETLLCNPAWIDPAALGRFRCVEVAPTEPGAANVLRVRGTVLVHPGFPRTMERLARAGYAVTPSDISEFLKAEAALTCKSLLLRELR